MQPGIFETVFVRPTLPERFEALASAGFRSVQFDALSAGIDPWRGEVPSTAASEIRRAADRAGIRIVAVSGTYNMAHPDPAVREQGHAGLVRTIALAAALGAPFVTVCTGTRSVDSMWRHHADNILDDAWTDMVASVTRALVAAHEHGVTLAVEPEPANVVASAARARTLLDLMADDALRIVFDPANIVLSDRGRDAAAVLQDAFDLLGPDIVLAHAKDLDHHGQFCAAGTGIVPWPAYWDHLATIGYDGDVIFHTLTEAEVPTALATWPTKQAGGDRSAR